MAEFTGAPWEAADGIVICQGGSDSGPGKILFVLRSPQGTCECYSHALLAEYAAFIVKAVNNHEALVKALERISHLTFADGTLTKAAKIAREVLAGAVGNAGSGS